MGWLLSHATHIYQWPLCAHVPAECWASWREQSPRGPREETSKQGLPNIVKSYQGISVFKPEADVGDFYEDLQCSDGVQARGSRLRGKSDRGEVGRALLLRRFIVS